MIAPTVAVPVDTDPEDVDPSLTSPRGEALVPMMICVPSETTAARFSSAGSASPRSPPAAARASSTLAPSGSLTTPGFTTAPITCTRIVRVAGALGVADAAEGDTLAVGDGTLAVSGDTATAMGIALALSNHPTDMTTAISVRAAMTARWRLVSRLRGRAESSRRRCSAAAACCDSGDSPGGSAARSPAGTAGWNRAASRARTTSAASGSRWLPNTSTPRQWAGRVQIRQETEDLWKVLAAGCGQFSAGRSTPSWATAVSYTHLRAHETDSYLVC